MSKLEYEGRAAFQAGDPFQMLLRSRNLWRGDCAESSRNGFGSFVSIAIHQFFFVLQLDENWSRNRLSRKELPFSPINNAPLSGTFPACREFLS